MDATTNPPPLESRDEAAFRKVLDHEQMLRGYIRARLRQPDLVEDIFQDVTLEIVRSWKTYDQTLPFEPWARAIAKRRCQEVRRRQRQQPISLDESVIEEIGGATDSHDQSELVLRGEALLACMKKLSKANQQLLQLYLDRLPKPEIARMVGKSVATLYVIVCRLRALLNDCVDRTVETL